MNAWPPLLTVLVLALASPALGLVPLAEMSVVTQAKLGVAVQALPAARHSAVATGFARVLDPGPLATLDADIAVAAAAVQASQAEAVRTRALAADATVSAKVAEAAAAQARGDAARLTLLRRRLGLEWGPAFLSMTDARRTNLVSALSSGRAALVRIDAAQGLAGVRSALLDLGPEGSATAQVLGPARTSDPRYSSNGVVSLVSGPIAARLGAGQTAQVRLTASTSTPGVVIPRSALLRTGGSTFAYVKRDATHFERRAVTGGVAEAQGLFAASGFRPGEAVVISGAAALHAAESAVKAGED